MALNNQNLLIKQKLLNEINKNKNRNIIINNKSIMNRAIIKNMLNKNMLNKNMLNNNILLLKKNQIINNSVNHNSVNHNTVNHNSVNHNTVNDNIIYKLINLPDIKKSKICIIYCYYERKNEQKNQTNLSFFIKYGLTENIWFNLDITVLFVINNYNCEVIIPKQKNIFILYEENCHDWEGWYNGIRYFENKFNKKFYDLFDYLCILNASTFGPIYEENNDSHWLIPFYEKMKITKSVACSPYINKWVKNTCYIKYGLSPHFCMIYISQHIYNLLINKNIKIEGFNNTVFGKKNNKYDAIITGEHLLSHILLINNYNICSLYPLNIDTYNCNINDREEFFHKNNNFLKKTIFIKNIWRIEKGQASLPILYDYCITYMNKKLKIKNIFENILFDYNYDNLLITNNINYYTNPANNNMEYYNLYGRAEEIIIFPKVKKNNNCVIYAHYDKNNIISDYIINALKIFIYCEYDILFYTSSDKIINIDLSILPFKVNFVKNMGSGTDLIIYNMGLKYILNNNFNYEWIMMINDSILLPINGIENFKNSIMNIRNTCDFWGHWDSNECEWHIILSPIEIKYKLINDVIIFFDEKIKLCTTKLDFIFNIEIKFAKYLLDRNYKHNVIININDLTIDNALPCPTHNPYIIKQWINKKKTFAIKWKYCISYLNKNIVSEYFNYLTRYLYYGPTGYISEGEKIGVFPKSNNFNIEKN
jgi:hypothetical protein